MFTSLRHWSICSRNYKDSTIHLSSTSNHVFNIVSMAWAVNVSIVTSFSLILNVSSINSNTSFSFFWSFVDISIINELSKIFCNSSSCSCFTMVYVSNSTNVNVRFSTVKFFFCHMYFLLFYIQYYSI